MQWGGREGQGGSTATATGGDAVTNAAPLNAPNAAACAASPPPIAATQSPPPVHGGEYGRWVVNIAGGRFRRSYCHAPLIALLVLYHDHHHHNHQGNVVTTHVSVCVCVCVLTLSLGTLFFSYVT